jgi:replicative DNA helicase
MTQRQAFDYHHFLHKPDDQAGEFLRWAQSIKDSPGIPFGIDEVDRAILPLRKGTETILLGRPGMCKTSMLLALARQESERIVEHGAWEEQAVVYVSYEQTAEELSAILQTNIPLDDLVRGRADDLAIRQTSYPMVRRGLWIVGHGLSRADPRAPRLTPENVWRTIRVIQEEYHREITLLCFDYLQIVPIERARDRVQAVTEIPIRVKELAMAIGCPVVLAAQAGRQVDAYEWPIPALADCQWGSSIEQAADLVLALWRPYNTFGPDAEPIPAGVVGDQSYPVTDKLLVMRMLKQRFKAGHYTWPLYLDPETLDIGYMIVEREPLLEAW